MGEMSVSLSDSLTLQSLPSLLSRALCPGSGGLPLTSHSPHCKKLTLHHTTRSSFYLDTINGAWGPAATWGGLEKRLPHKLDGHPASIF